MTQFLTVRAAAMKVGASERTIRRWVAAGDLPASRVGKKFVRINETDLEQFMRPIPSAR